GGRVIAGRRRVCHRSADRRSDPSRHLVLFPHSLDRSTAAAAGGRNRVAARGEPRRRASAPGQEPSGTLQVSDMASVLVFPRLSSDDLPIVIAAGFVLVILAAGTAYTLTTLGTAPLLTPNYLLTQLQTGAFLGIVACGMMTVILLGHIDLSVPWTMTAAAMMATTVGGPAAIPTGLVIGLLVGLFNGFGVAHLRIPSMIFTLGVDSVMRGL